MKEKLFNLALRASTLAGKFFLIFSLAKLLPAAQVGTYGLISATILYLLYLIGLDFYTYSSREFIQTPLEKWGGLLKSKIAFFFCMYLTVLPVSIFLFKLNLLPKNLIIYLLALTIFEHLNQELNRFLIICKKQTTASIVLFLRSGIWCYSFSTFAFYDISQRNIDAVLTHWIAGNIVASSIGIYTIINLEIKGWKDPININWIKRGIRIAVPFLIGTLAIRAIYTLDKYWLEAITNLQIVGAYVLYIGICNALMSFLDAGVFMYSYPELIRAKNEQDSKKFQKEKAKMYKQTAIACITFSILSYIFLPIIINWLDSDIYKNQITSFWILLFGSVTYAISMVPHYCLYAHKEDKIIITSHLKTLMVFILSTLVLTKLNPELAVPLGLSTALFFMLLDKQYNLKKLTHK